MHTREWRSAKYHYLNESIGEIFWNTAGNALSKFIPWQAGNDPIGMLIFGGIGVVTLSLTSPVWAPFVGIYAVGKKISNHYEKKQMQVVWDKEDKDQLAADMVMQENKIKSMPMAPKVSFAEDPSLVKDSALDKLPKDLSGIIGGFLDQQSLSQLILTSRSTHSLFNQSWKASALLNFVKNSNYDKAYELLNPASLHLLFKRETLVHVDGSQEYLSPLELSIKQFDLKMWNLFKLKIDRVANDDLTANFNTSSHAAAGNYTNLLPLFDAYASFQNLYAAWMNDNSISVERLSESLLTIATMQRESLPQHVLNDFANNHIKWEIKSDFSNLQKADAETSQRFALSSNVGSSDICMRGNREYSGMTFVNVTTKGLCFDKNNPQSNEIKRERLEKLASALRYDAVVLNHLVANKSAELTERIMTSNQSNNTASVSALI